MRPFAFLALILCIGLNACSSPSERTRGGWMEPNEKLKVLCTIGMIQDIVQAVGGELVDSHTLIQGELDPHSYELVKGDDEKFAFAELIFCNGLGLEHGPSMRRQLEGNDKTVALGNRIFESDPELILDIGGQPDPHIWMDVRLWMKAVPFVVEALERQRPESADSFRRHAATLLREMAAVDKEIFDLLQAIPQERRYLVTSHDAFNYFARRYLAENGERNSRIWEKRCEAPEGLAPEGQLSTVDIQRLIDHLAEYKITVLFPESNVSRDSINKIVQAGSEKGLAIRIATPHLYADAMGAPGSPGDTYLKMISHNAHAIAKHLRGDGAP